MTDTYAPFGLRPVRRACEVETLRNAIASGYAFNIMTGDPIVLLTNGTIERAGSGPTGTVSATGAVGIYGVFAGCTYTDSFGRRQVSPYWPASTTATDIDVQYWRDLDKIEFAVQANGALTQAAMGDAADFANLGDGNTLTGQSACGFGTLAGSGNPGAMRVIGLLEQPGNAWGDTYPIVIVKINRLAGFFSAGSANAI